MSYVVPPQFLQRGNKMAKDLFGVELGTAFRAINLTLAKQGYGWATAISGKDNETWINSKKYTFRVLATKAVVTYEVKLVRRKNWGIENSFPFERAEVREGPYYLGRPTAKFNISEDGEFSESD